MHRGNFVKKEKHPWETSGPLTKYSFLYIIPLLKKGYFKCLNLEDVYEVLKSCRSQNLSAKLEKYWNQETKTRKHPSLFRALFRCFGKTVVLLGLIQVTMLLITTVGLPYAQSKLISYFSPGQTEVDRKDAIYFASVVIGLKVFNTFVFDNLLLYLVALGLSVKAAVSSLIYRKSLRLNHEALSQVTIGKITTIINRDVEILHGFIMQANQIWICSLHTILVCFLIYQKIGISSWAGIAFFFVVFPIQMFIGKLAYKYRLNCSFKTDDRLEVTQDVISAIKIIKMYTWEKIFEKKINDARKTELNELFKLFYTKIWISVIGTISSKIAFFIFVVSYAFNEDDVTAETVYYILSCFGDLQTSLSQGVPLGFSKLAETLAVTKRCEKILQETEAPLKTPSTEVVCSQIYFFESSIKTQGATILNNVSLDITEKGLHVVAGHVGSGKSTFLRAIMQDCQLSGAFKVSGSISYASQEPWLFPSTIRNNILFGVDYSENRYQQILKMCCLDFDIEFFEEGDNTVVGDRGINLSKGQQARINLARALYKNSDLYLLDDCLASLDAQVSDHIFKNCIKDFLRDKICIFVTNNVNYVEEADKILLIKDGTLKFTTNIDKKSFNFDNGREVTTTDKREFDPPTGIYYEQKNSDKVTFSDYKKYISYGGGIIFFVLIIGLFTLHQGLSSYSEKLLSNWVTLEQNASNLNFWNLSETPEYEKLDLEKTNSLILYCSIFGVTIFFFVASTFTFFFFVKTASTNLHKNMLRNVMKATMNFFDVTMIGNILTRFSKDCVIADEYVPFSLMEAIKIIFVVGGGCLLLTTVSVVFLVECLLLLVAAYILKRIFQPTGRNLQRLHVIARCPMVGHVNSTLTGLLTIRASNAENIVTQEFDKYQDQFTSCHYMLDSTLIAMALSIDLVTNFFIAIVIIQLLAFEFEPTVGDAGLSISQAISISSMTASAMLIFFECENLMTSVERILEYVGLSQEKDTEDSLQDWPTIGSIQYKEVSLSYGCTKQPVLKNINFAISKREKLGIVGRTGAGKSSIISILLRLYENLGQIIIDDVDIKNVSLKFIRSQISVLTQEPFLFPGTIRENLDPLAQSTDVEIWKVLSDLNLKQWIEDLNQQYNKNSNLSAGQKQLLCLARVILRKNKIVILDEASANIDAETDKLICDAMFTYFSDCTVITVAHRLSSVLRCDRVIVMKGGEICENDEPKKLLENKNSFFHRVII